MFKIVGVGPKSYKISQELGICSFKNMSPLPSQWLRDFKASLSESIFHSGEVLEESYSIKKLSLIYLAASHIQGNSEHSTAKDKECTWRGWEGGGYGLPLLIKQQRLNHGIFTLNTLSGPNCFPKDPPLSNVAYLLHHGDYAKVRVLQGHSSYEHTSPGVYAFLTQFQRYPLLIGSFKHTPDTQASTREIEVGLKPNEIDFLTQSHA